MNARPGSLGAETERDGGKFGSTAASDEPEPSGQNSSGRSTILK